MRDSVIEQLTIQKSKFHAGIKQIREHHSHFDIAKAKHLNDETRKKNSVQ